MAFNNFNGHFPYPWNASSNFIGTGYGSATQSSQTSGFNGPPTAVPLTPQPMFGVNPAGPPHPFLNPSSVLVFNSSAIFSWAQI